MQTETVAPAPRQTRLPCVGCGAFVEGSRCTCGMAVKAGPFRIVRLIAQNAHARMYMAEDAAGRRAALKEFIFAAAPDQRAIETFYREAKLLQRLSHPSIPRFITAFQEGSGPAIRLYLAQELVVGEPLSQRLNRRRIEEGEALGIAREVLETLIVLHDHKPIILHRDIKPQNLIRRLGGNIALVDFGAAKELNADATSGATVVGTVGYMPPEQLFGGTIDATSDLYSLGASLLHMVTKRPPESFLGEDMAIEWGKDAQLTPQFKKFLAKLAARKRDQRFHSAEEALRALNHVTGQVQALSSEVAQTPSLPRVAWHKLLRVAGSLAVLSLTSAVVVGVVYGVQSYLNRPKAPPPPPPAPMVVVAPKPVEVPKPKLPPPPAPKLAPPPPVVFNASKDFGIKANPNGPWTYGWSDALGTSFEAFKAGFVSTAAGTHDILKWNQFGKASEGNEILVNHTNDVQHRGKATLGPWALVIYPDKQDTKYSVMRWTAPKGGEYTITSRFKGVCANGSQKTRTEVFVLHGKHIAFNYSLNASGQANDISDERKLFLNQGETVDFAVHTAVQAVACRSTQLEAVITGNP